MRLARMTLAVDDPDGMVAFYNACFDCDLAPVPGSPLFAGTFGGVELYLCPNSVARVVAELNRHQLRVAVEDPESVARAVVAAGGGIVNRFGSAEGLVIGVEDPEGNTLELVPS